VLFVLSGTCYRWLSDTQTLTNSLSYVLRLGSLSVPTFQNMIWLCLLSSINIFRPYKEFFTVLSNLPQDAVENGRLHPKCHHLINWTKHMRFDTGPCAPLCENMTTSTIPIVHNVLQCHKSRTEPWPTGRSFIRYCGQGSSLLWTPALRPLCRSNAPAQGEEGNW